VFRIIYTSAFIKASNTVGFDSRPYSTVGFLFRLMTFTIKYETTAVAVTVKANQISNLAMSSILPLAGTGFNAGARQWAREQRWPR
jgi:hypothetical protein